MSFNPNQDHSGEASDPVTVALDWCKKHWKLLVGIAVALLIGLTPLLIISFNNGANDDGNRKQNQLMTMYRTMSQQLSDCLNITRLGAQIAVAERESFKDTMTSIVLAESGNGKPVDIGVNSVAITTLQRAYPTISNELFKELAANAVGCRREFVGRMDHLQFAAGEFKSWTETGGFFDRSIHNNFPTDKLTVVVGGEKRTGQEALDFMITPIMTTEALQATETKVMPDQNVFPSGTGG
jgi:hypothetical protein